MKLNKRVALVTGSGSGIGQAIANLFAESGAKTVIADKSFEAAQATSEQLKSKNYESLCLNVDITSKTEVTRMIENVLKKWGQIDILVNNVGGAFGNDLLDINEDQWDKDIELNLTATARCIKTVLPHMIKNGRGSVINISSVNGLAAYDLMAYGAAKAGVINLTQNLAVSYGSHGIRFNAVCPGSVHTPVWTERLREFPDTFSDIGEWYPLGRVGKPEDVARAALFFASDDSSWITGQALAVDGGLTAGNLHMINNFMRK
jgi:NAD(P)-dependent dehydrogenase (short-subunit alcohol dehydrogenase family)